MVNINQALQNYGLSEKESKVYVSLLALGQSTANTIAKKANLNRVTCYDVLKYLQEKGLVSYAIKSGVKYYESAPPKKFIGDLKEKQEMIKQVLPDLEALKQSSVKKPTIEIYQGIAGLKTILEDVIKEAKETWFIADVNFMDSLEFYFPHFIKRKRKEKIFSKVITTDCKRMRNYKKKAPKTFVNLKFIKQNLPTTKIIYGDKIAILTFNKESSIGLLIENKDIAETEKRIFNSLWNSF
jgi:sugar-specific transcriptional regulator TrmB